MPRLSRITDIEIAELRQIDSAMRAKRESGDVKGIILLIHKFHHLIYAAARMSTCKQLIENQWLRSGPYVNLLFNGYTSEERGQLRGHVEGNPAARCDHGTSLDGG